MPSNAAVSFPEPDDFRRREFPRLVPPSRESAPPTRDEPLLAPPGAVPPGAVASAELPWEQPRPRGIRPPVFADERWRVMHAAAGGTCVLFLLLLALAWLGLLGLTR
ncbi:MAG: hypothetical protein ABW277_08135 [Longimicrobiaceae bacterium]